MISKFHYITGDLTDFTHYQLAEEACKGGAGWIQLRMKNKSFEDFLKIALKTKNICKKYNAKLIINDNVPIAKEIKADGVHLGKNDMHPDDAREILGEKFIIGCSSNNFEDIMELSEHKIDYIGLGPYRFTMTKENLSPVLGIEGLRRIMFNCKTAGISIPVIAIGGINFNDIIKILNSGVHGIAISSAINFAADKQTQVKRILNKIERY
jgi:thiamine-phosphate pyrophosphorylase